MQLRHGYDKINLVPNISLKYEEMSKYEKKWIRYIHLLVSLHQIHDWDFSYTSFQGCHKFEKLIKCWERDDNNEDHNKNYLIVSFVIW